MSVFEPSVARAICCNSLSPPQRAKFDDEWDTTIRERIQNWTENRDTQSTNPDQIEWSAAVVAYVNFIWTQTRVHGNAKEGTAPSKLKNLVPLWGPRFLPPTYLSLQKREPVLPSIRPQLSFLKPLTVIHPVFFSDSQLRICPQCGCNDKRKVTWNSWANTGYRELRGIRHGECAIGFQLRCELCQDDRKTHCFSLSSWEFWKTHEFWDIPRGIPIFFARSGLTRELFDLIIELRPSMTSGGLAEHIKHMCFVSRVDLGLMIMLELHLLEKKQRELEYLRAFELRNPQRGQLQTVQLECFEAASSHIVDKPITDDAISDVYLEANRRTRAEESSEYLKTLHGLALSLDATFKSANKAKVTTTSKSRVSLLKGGLLSMVNKRNEIIAWRLCQTQTNAEIAEILKGLVKRFAELGVPMTKEFIADNCCHIIAVILEFFPLAHLGLDVWHLIARYLAAVVNGSKNPWRTSVARDVSDAILIERAQPGQPARYRTKADQEIKLQAMYENFVKTGSVWSAAAPQVHKDQLAHVKCGCLERHLQDIAVDGSQIEGAHKAWNSLQRANPSGVEMFKALGSDFVLRRNIRIASKLQQHPSPFVATTNGSHHVRLCNAINMLFNALALKEKSRGIKTHYLQRAIMPIVNSDESFGLVKSENLLSFGGLWTIKEEPDDEDALLEVLEDSDNGLSSDIIADELKIEPSLLEQPLATSSQALSGSVGMKTSSVAVSTEPTIQSPPFRVSDAVIDPELLRQDGYLVPGSHVAAPPSAAPQDLSVGASLKGLRFLSVNEVKNRFNTGPHILSASSDVMRFFNDRGNLGCN